MTRRFTQTEKWDDTWFRSLSPNAKVLYWYIWDKCNIAGFWEIDLEGAKFHTKISKRGIEGAFEELQRGFETNGSYIWLRRFLYHQKNLPLKPENPAHKGILRLIEEYKHLFPNILSLLEKQLTKEKTKGASKGLLSPISKGKGISKSKGKDYSTDFETFWNKYPERWIPESDKHVKIGKHKAWEEWVNIDEQAQKLIIAILPVYRRKISSKIIPDAWRWLRDRKWDDYSPPQSYKPLPDNIPIPKFKNVPEDKPESTSDKVNRQLKALTERK